MRRASRLTNQFRMSLECCVTILQVLIGQFKVHDSYIELCNLSLNKHPQKTKIELQTIYMRTKLRVSGVYPWNSFSEHSVCVAAVRRPSIPRAKEAFSPTGH